MSTGRFILLSIIGIVFVWIGSIGTILWIGRGWGGGGSPSADHAAVHYSEPSSEELPILWKAPTFEYPDQSGQAVSQQSLLGQVWIANFIFTRCTTVCPTLSAEMVMLQRNLVHPDFRFVSFSVDPDHDSPEVLETYASRWGAEERWLLLSTDTQTLNSTAEGMGVAVAKTDDEENPIIHSSLFLLVDAQGQVRGAYDSKDPVAMKRLLAEARSLLRETDRPRALAEAVPAQDADGIQAGAKIYAALSCAACHEQPKIAPPLTGLWGRPVALHGGGTAMADEDYMRESILDAGAKRVAGYLPLMPSYRDQLSTHQVAQLVAYLQSLEGDSGDGAGPAPDAAAVAVDPVCEMEVRVVHDTPQAAYAGETYYFCNQGCREKFVQVRER